ncbi:short-chain dehydrogenase/reductase family 16C member 6-like [Adelges cooleyi]|uniref:short-chain dehydrogenase/reductase family 16C member 6-like n=1 Tax=Adelges cooleyi TaxID=133065 RepID=UPI0021807AFD|nr:short-chain dehydrogenase/reductase family 16C member 6-like [Adelges cooleyi]
MANTNNSYALLPADPIKLLFQIALCILLIIPTVLLAMVKQIIGSQKKIIRGQIVVITGAGQGLGRELSMRFYRLGAKVACVDVNGDSAIQTAQAIKDAGGVARAYAVDVTKRDQIKSMHEAIKKEWGQVDIVVNNAAIVKGHLYVTPNSDKIIEDIVDVNLLGQYWVNREILPSMLERNSGQIVAISSMSSMSGLASASSYAATKWATNGMMECLHNELKSLNSNVVSTTVCPYFIDTTPDISTSWELRLPAMPTSYAAEIIMNGILENRRIFSVPNHLMCLVAFGRLLPDNWQEYASKIFSVKILPTLDDKEVEKNYRIKSSAEV